MECARLDIFADLNDPQREAVMHVEGPLLVLAGAGSGKTRVITRRIAYLIQQGVAPWSILAITFTNKAAGEMARRVEALGAPRGSTVGTFHSLCARLLREFAAEAQLLGDFSIYDRDDQLRTLKEAMELAELPPQSLIPSRVHSVISNAKNDLQTASAFAEHAEDFVSRQVAKAYEQYERLLRTRNALDFDDLLLRTCFLLRTRPDIRVGLSNRYQFILIDEYQDTNRAQYILAHGLASEHENLCATGDPDQSIYAWRGADIRNILEFEQDYPHAKVVRLEENYRSTRPVLEGASRLIAHNLQRKDKRLWTRREGGRNVHVVRCADEHAEARELSRRIAAARNEGRDYDDIAIFYRINSLSRVIEEELIRAGVPYRIARGVEFYNRKEIKDVIAYLRLLVNPVDDLSCLRVINTPPRGIGATTVNRLADYARTRGVSVLDAARRAPETGLGNAAAGKVLAFAQMIDSFRASLHVGVAELMQQVIERSGLQQALEQAREKEGDRPLSNVEELRSQAAEFDEMSPGASLADYLYQVSLISDVDHLEGTAGAVTLMTLHAAKGLEFPVVFVIGWEEGLLPMQRFDEGGDDHDHIEEERRLAFVGMTRAMDELTISCARMRRRRGVSESQSESRFLSELEGEGVEEQDCGWAGGARGFSALRHRAGGFYADADDRSAIESAAGPRPDFDDLPPPDTSFPPEYEHLRVGCLVRHPKFGIGKVTSISQPWPDTRVKILFPHLGEKTIVAAYTHLEIPEEV